MWVWYFIYIFFYYSKNSYGGGVMWGQHIKILAPWIMRIYLSLLLRPVYTKGDTRASSPSPPVWATATCASDGHPVIDEVSIHRHPASCNRGASLSGQLSVLRWGWVCSNASTSFGHYAYQWLDTMLSPKLTFTNIYSFLSGVQMVTESRGARDYIKWVWTVVGVTRCSSAWRPPH